MAPAESTDVDERAAGLREEPLHLIQQGGEEAQVLVARQVLAVAEDEAADAVLPDRLQLRRAVADSLVARDHQPSFAACLRQPFAVRSIGREAVLEPDHVVADALETIGDASGNGAVDEDHAAKERSNSSACSIARRDTPKSRSICPGESPASTRSRMISVRTPVPATTGRP